MNILEVKGLNKKQGKFSLKDVSFELPMGYIMGFIGKNGAGKTTTINCILNLLPFESGEVHILGEKFTGDEVHLKEALGVVFDEINFYEFFTVENYGKTLGAFYKEWDEKLFMSYLKKFEIDGSKKISKLSKGMKMKAQIAFALSRGARLLIMDEPTSGLDPVARRELMEIFQDYIADGTKSILFSTHITSDIEGIADYITFIKDGQIVFAQEREQLNEDYILVKGGLDELNQLKDVQFDGIRKNKFGFSAIVKRDKIGKNEKFSYEKITIEDFMYHICGESGE